MSTSTSTYLLHSDDVVMETQKSFLETRPDPKPILGYFLYLPMKKNLIPGPYQKPNFVVGDITF